MYTEILKMQGRNQTTADVSRMTRYLGQEMNTELLQWTSKMDTYKKYKWSVGDMSTFSDLGPPIIIKPGWNVEYPFLPYFSILKIIYVYFCLSFTISFFRSLARSKFFIG